MNISEYVTIDNIITLDIYEIEESTLVKLYLYIRYINRITICNIKKGLTIEKGIEKNEDCLKVNERMK